MAKYDYGGGCPCGLYRECIPQCVHNTGTYSMVPQDSPKFEPITLEYTPPLEQKKESVNHPDHYNPGVYEAINIIEAYELGFHLGNAIKYILRAGKKHDNIQEDIDKAIWYLNRYKDTV